MEKQVSDKKAVLCFLLCLLFGVLGFHRFYVGKIGTGFIQLITGGMFGLWTLWDLIIILFDKFEDKEGRSVLW